MKTQDPGQQPPIPQNHWDAELLHRIANIENESQNIKSMTRRDYIAAGIVIAISLCAVVAGAFI